MNAIIISSSVSTGYSSFVAGSAARPSASTEAVDNGLLVGASEESSQVVIAGDQVTISDEAINKLKAEAQGTDTANAEEPSDVKKFVYGVVGLDRPTKESEAQPSDGYTYGRGLAAAFTSAAVLSVLI